MQLHFKLDSTNGLVDTPIGALIPRPGINCSHGFLCLCGTIIAACLVPGATGRPGRLQHQHLDVRQPCDLQEAG
jgi:hypothetical protein